jgi:hypothetical protein
VSTRIPADADPFLVDLIRRLDADPRVVGLVLAGSSAERSRRDRWSDHDFLVITQDGTPEQLRTDLSWLPDADDIGYWFRDTPHGLKALYRSGLLLEFAVFDRAEFDACALNHAEVVIDGGGIAEAAASIRERSLAPAPMDRMLAFRSFLTLVYIGTGRAHRGERLSANVFLRDFATAHLLRAALGARVPDALDPWRRVEGAWPDLAAAVDAALTQPVTEVGPALLACADRFLSSEWAEFPAGEVDLVRGLLSGD